MSINDLTKELSDEYIGQLLLLLLGGNCRLTFQSRKTGKHFTFKIKRDAKEGNEHIFYVRHNSDLVATIDQYTMQLSYYPKTMKPSPEQEAISYVWQNGLKPETLKKNLKIMHWGTCAKCGRPLTDPISIMRGIGPDCWKSMN